MESVQSPKSEIFYWVTIMFSQTLGTALGDCTAHLQGVGYLGAASIFGSLLLILIGMYFRTNISRTFLLWSAFILSRPLGAALGDFLDKPLQQGGLELSRITASLALIIFIVLCLMLTQSKTAEKSH